MGKIALAVLVLSLASLLGGCELLGSLGDTAPGTGGDNGASVFSTVLYVNAATGANGNPGTSSGKAFKTVTKALSLAKTGQTVQVAPGTYDAALGETFPLVIPAGVILQGNEGAQGAGTVLSGGGPIPSFTAYSATVLPSTGSTLAGFTVSALAGHMGIALDSTSTPILTVTVAHNTVQGGKHGIYRFGGTTGGGTVSENVFQSNQTDIAFVGGSDTLVVTANTFHDAIEFDGNFADLGGGAGSSPGLNTFLASGHWFEGVVSARNNHWPHSPPTFNASFTFDSSKDISVVFSGSVDVTGYY